MPPGHPPAILLSLPPFLFEARQRWLLCFLPSLAAFSSCFFARLLQRILPEPGAANTSREGHGQGHQWVWVCMAVCMQMTWYLGLYMKMHSNPKDLLC